MKIVSFTPIKLNNQRLPGKNTMPLGGKGKVLCEHLFETLKDVPSLQDRYVFCSDEKILKFMPEWMTFLKRDPVLDGPEIRGLQIIEAFVNMVKADVYVLCHVTAPFIQASTIEHAVEQMKTGQYDSAFTAQSVSDYGWYKGRPINYDMKNIVQTQNLEPIYLEKGEVFIFTRELFQAHRQRIGFKPYIQEINEFEAVDIDTKEDFDFAKAIAAYLNK